MTAEEVFHCYRGYKFYFQGRCRLDDSGMPILHHPEFAKQHDRAFYHRLATKLNNAQLVALFVVGSFYRPDAYIADFVTPDAIAAGLAWEARRAKDRIQLEDDLYVLRKQLGEAEIRQHWLYGILPDSTQLAFPGCITELIAGTVQPEVVALLVLHKYRDLAFLKHWKAQPDFGIGHHAWIARLVRLDLWMNATYRSWRIVSMELAHEFWDAFPDSLAPQKKSLPSLF